MVLEGQRQLIPFYVECSVEQVDLWHVKLSLLKIFPHGFSESVLHDNFVFPTVIGSGFGFTEEARISLFGSQSS